MAWLTSHYIGTEGDDLFPGDIFPDAGAPGQEPGARGRQAGRGSGVRGQEAVARINARYIDTRGEGN